MLDPTQRELLLDSPYDELYAGQHVLAGTMHVVDTEKEEWITLRGVSPLHEPQVYFVHKELSSSMAHLLWRESHAEWVHDGEAESLKEHVEELKRKQAHEAEKRRKAEQAKRTAEALRAERARIREGQRRAEEPAETRPTSQQPFPGSSSMGHWREPAPEPEPLPAWISGGLICVGCGQPTENWQTAKPSADQCVCRACFAKGVQLS